MDVACSTSCFTKLSLEDAARKILELEFSKVELDLDSDRTHLSPSIFLQSETEALQALDPISGIPIAAMKLSSLNDQEQDRQILQTACNCAKQMKIPTIIVDCLPNVQSMESEIDRLKEFERISTMQGITLSIANSSGTLADNPESVRDLCKSVPGLGFSFDPSYWLEQLETSSVIESIFPMMRHVRFRDSAIKQDGFMVPVGRGAIEYGRIYSSLKQVNYTGCLTVCIEDWREVHFPVEPEIRKLRLLLESLM